MISDILKGIVYTEFDDVLGPDPKIWFPTDMGLERRMLISIKTITLLTGEEDIIPKNLIIIPFPSLNLKALVKYVEWKDPERRGGIARTSITLLFKDEDDAIFYKYREDFEALFNEIAQKIAELEASKAEKKLLTNELYNFQSNIIKLLEELRNQELAAEQKEAFPEKEVPEEQVFDYRYKIIVCGDPGAGKTSIVLRFTDNAFRRTYMPTIGVQISEKTIHIENSRVQLVVWDLAGQSKFEMMRTHFYQGSEAILLIFDLTREKTFKSIRNWHNDVQKAVENNNLIKIGFILGNKNDLIDERKVSGEEAERLSNELNLEYLESSALTGENIESIFRKIAETLIRPRSN